MIERINRQGVVDLIGKPERVVLVEALPEKYYNDAHIPGAVQMDYTEVTDKAPSVLGDKDRKIVVYCASSECENSTKAARTLQQLGYDRIYVYKEGKQDWIEAGLRVESAGE